MKRIDIPKQVINCKDWLLANKRFPEYHKMTSIIRMAEREAKLDGPMVYWLKSILEEYCHAHKITPHYKENVSGFYENGRFTDDAEELFNMLFREDAAKRRREGR